MLETFSEEPWRICYREHAPKLLLFARQWVHSMADAEDVVQSAFVKFWRHQPAALPAHYPLLYAAVRSSALDLLRTDARRARREQGVAGEFAEPFFEHALDRREDTQIVEAALAQLPAAQREVLVLRVWGELTFAEIAQTIGESINTVTSRHRYALEALRRTVKPHQYERA